MAERAGTPALAVMTANFTSAAELMARVLGVPDYLFGVIAHPISSATDEELVERANIVTNYIRQLILD
jgi:hypothetical protein|tara:strand:- start:1281 stop:1484 length:204 start_codon:yes stop_codon:yes gene_type:complete